ncbi:hypothetical protein EMIHUDRAFT_469783 [Emiliania huxleyi CCMP1516]|uniref:Bicarbonate transporter-like transmembrane domain-containing protein n=2 Tax=Emiliania huxleyi TaxID=2903 RepID=A0A0D3JDF3_EMIH1|nr:hypothetical protein EMIHUDRAFT_469783 [Emiliania huxleyi CCMP1516]EOD21538.1 hypothetical protein EMIHUDRAFT_469783 [Emiliania huxleyi CCMP1516]|eukprot:XP_005773967.1 hypothetical protein EMIHUDRAFT_469783 [Emiliania huxleyi CCMP1516]
MQVATGGQLGIVETIISRGVCGMLYASLAGQPMTFIGPTGLTLAFTTALYAFVTPRGIPFLPMYTWVGLWTCGFLSLAACTNAANLIRYCTRFTEDVFNAFLGTSYLHSSATAMWMRLVAASRAAAAGARSAASASASALLSLCWGLLTFGACEGSTRLSASRYFPRTLRSLIADFGLAAAILFFLDQNITVRTVNSERNKLIPRATYHLDLADWLEQNVERISKDDLTETPTTAEALEGQPNAKAVTIGAAKATGSDIAYKLSHLLALVVAGVIALLASAALADGRSVIKLKDTSNLPRLTALTATLDGKTINLKDHGLDYRADELLGPQYGVGLHHDSSGYGWGKAGARETLQEYIDELGLLQVIAAVPSVIATDGLKHPAHFLECTELKKAGLSAMSLAIIAEVASAVMIIFHGLALVGLLPLSAKLAKGFAGLVWWRRRPATKPERPPKGAAGLRSNRLPKALQRIQRRQPLGRRAGKAKARSRARIAPAALTPSSIAAALPLVTAPATEKQAASSTSMVRRCREYSVAARWSPSPVRRCSRGSSREAAVLSSGVGRRRANCAQAAHPSSFLESRGTKMRWPITPASQPTGRAPVRHCPALAGRAASGTLAQGAGRGVALSWWSRRSNSGP